MIPRLFAVVAVLLAANPALGAQAAPAPREELYRFVMIQAAPGRLLDLLALYQERAPVIAAGGDELPIIVRHSQGDRWDIIVIYPSGSFTEYYSRERVARREAAAKASGVSTDAFARKFYDLVAWHEDVYVTGPPLAELRAYLKGCTLAHFEMMQALAGRRDELVKERQMESVFNVERGLPAMLLFTHEQGAAWDVITLDAWRDWRQYGEMQTTPGDVAMAAAKKAGFASPDAVSVYMRTLISTHHDTLGRIVNATPRPQP